MTDLTLNLVWMLQGLMNTLAALSSGEWLMKPSSLERGILQSKALSKYTIENNYKKNTYLLCCHFNQSYYSSI